MILVSCQQDGEEVEGKAASDGDGRVGCGGTQQFELKVLGAGEAALEFDDKRPWEEKEPAKTVSLKLEIED